MIVKRMGLVSSRPFDRLLRIVCRYLRMEKDASVSVEFALMAIPFFGLIFCIIEIGVVLLIGVTVENTTQQISRLIKTGQLQAYNLQSAADFRARVLCPSSGKPLLPAYMSCSRLSIDIRPSNTLNNADLTDDFYQSTSTQHFCLGGSQSIIVVRLAYAFPSLLPVLAIISNGSIAQSKTGLVNDVPGYPGWNHMLFDATAFQNENFGSGSTSCT